MILETGVLPGQTGAPGRIRTRDPLLRRHIRAVAGRRLSSLYEPSNSSYCRWPSDGVARRRSPLAPQLAPSNLVAFANVRIVENNVTSLLRRVAREPCHPSCNAASSAIVEKRAQCRRYVRQADSLLDLIHGDRTRRSARGLHSRLASDSADERARETRPAVLTILALLFQGRAKLVDRRPAVVAVHCLVSYNSGPEYAQPGTGGGLLQPDIDRFVCRVVVFMLENLLVDVL